MPEKVRKGAEDYLSIGGVFLSQLLTESEMLDLAAKIAVQARIDEVERSQIENLLAMVETALDPKNSPQIVALYAYRQVDRRRIGKRTADLIHEAMNKLSEKGGRREDVRRLLGLVKWIYEALGILGEGPDLERRLKVEVKNLDFQGVLKMLRGG
ncbi:MAG: hypothetical protein QXQ20_08650 [Candidatus Nezhaarchaeales archaeon]